MSGGTVEFDPASAIAALRKQGASDEEVHRYLVAKGYAPVDDSPSPLVKTLHRQQQTPAGRKLMATNVREANAADRPGQMANLQGSVDALAQEVPFLERGLTKARSVVQGEPYDQALKELRTSEDEAPAIATIPARLAGMAATGYGAGRLLKGGEAAAKLSGPVAKTIATLTKTPTRVAAVLGGAQPLGAADEEPAWERAARTAVGAGGAALFSKALDALSTGGRALTSPSGGTNAIDMEQEIALADAPAYGQARAEAAASGKVPAIRQAAKKADIAPFIKAAKGLREMQGKSDAEVAMEAFKFMSGEERQYALREAAGNLTSEDRAMMRNIGAAKAELKSAIATAAPSFPDAVAQHATMMGEAEARQTGADATRRLLTGTKIAGKKEAVNSPEAFLRDAATMTPAEKAQALSGTLSRTKEFMKPSANPFSGFGIVPSVYKAGKAQTFIDALEPKTPFQKLLRAFGTGEASGKGAQIGSGPDDE